jgi:hypothetical protein
MTLDGQGPRTLGFEIGGKKKMTEKFDYFEAIGILIPGVLFVCSLPLLFPGLTSIVEAARLPDAFAVIALTAASAFAGYVLQGLGSLLKGPLRLTYRGLPPHEALESGLDEHFTPEVARAIRTTLKAHATANDSNAVLYSYATRLAKSTSSETLRRFHALYVYHRSLVVLILIVGVLFAASFRAGLASRLNLAPALVVSGVLFTLFAVCWHRTRRRSMYHIREVLHCANEKLRAESTVKPASFGAVM